MFEDTAYDTVLAGMELDAHFPPVVLIHVRDLVHFGKTVFQHDALGDSRKIGLGQGFVQRDMVYLARPVRRMREVLGHIAVVGKEQHARGITVETTYGINPFTASAIYQFHDRLAFFGIFRGGDIALGLVQQQIDFLFRAQGLFSKLHLVVRPHQGTQHRADHSVHQDRTRFDHRVGFPARADARIGDITVQTDIAGLLLAYVFGMTFLIARLLTAGTERIPVPETTAAAFVTTEASATVVTPAETAFSAVVSVEASATVVTPAETAFSAIVTVEAPATVVTPAETAFPAIVTVEAPATVVTIVETTRRTLLRLLFSPIVTYKRMSLILISS